MSKRANAVERRIIKERKRNRLTFLPPVTSAVVSGATAGLGSTSMAKRLSIPLTVQRVATCQPSPKRAVTFLFLCFRTFCRFGSEFLSKRIAQIVCRVRTNEQDRLAHAGQLYSETTAVKRCFSPRLFLHRLSSPARRFSDAALAAYKDPSQRFLVQEVLNGR